MRSMVEGQEPLMQRLWRVPLHRPAGGPPPRFGEDRSDFGHFARSSSISPAVALALPTTPGMPAPGWVPAPTR
jgi:hypothetical protein